MKKRLVGVLGTLALAATTVTGMSPTASVVADPLADASREPVEPATSPSPTVTPAATAFGALVAPSHPTAAPRRPQPSVAPGVVRRPTPKPKPKASVPTVAQARAYARRQVGATQFRCLDRLWEKESSWNPRARNRSSGAYGIPQALPGRKMAAAGADWRRNPVTQVRWGLRYIEGRYGSPCSAWRHSQAVNWY